MFLSDLKPGQKAIIQTPVQEVSVKLFEMGCLPGEAITMLYAAPFNDPICFEVQGTKIAMRQAVAQVIPIKLTDEQ